ncbi:MAG: ribosomal protein S18-alanine N-acetyltransferase [Candidatus Binatia bacterium]
MIESETKSSTKQAANPQERERLGGYFAAEESVRFRPMTIADMDEIMAIERISYRFPWSQGFFLQELQVACARSILAEVEGRIIGYVLFWLLPGAIDIHNVAIHEDFRRRGFARLLLGKVLAQASAQSINRVTLEVRRSNVPAQKLYESMGFLTIGVRKGYYSDDGEDALAMTLELAAQS